jgi:hypothetical protein
VRLGGVESLRSLRPHLCSPRAEFFSLLRARHKAASGSPVRLLGQERVLGGAKIEKHAFAVGGILAEGVLVILDRK